MKVDLGFELTQTEVLELPKVLVQGKLSPDC